MNEEDLTISLKSSIEANKKIRLQTLAMIEEFQKEIPAPKFTKATLKFYKSLLKKTKNQTENIMEEIKEAKEKYKPSLNSQLEKVKKEVKIHTDQIEFLQSVRSFDIDSNSLDDLVDFLQNKISFIDNEIDENRKKVQALKTHLHELQAQNFEKRNKQAQEDWENELSLERERNEINAPIQRRHSEFIQPSLSDICSSKITLTRRNTCRDNIHAPKRTITGE